MFSFRRGSEESKEGFDRTHGNFNFTEERMTPMMLTVSDGMAKKGTGAPDTGTGTENNSIGPLPTKPDQSLNAPPAATLLKVP